MPIIWFGFASLCFAGVNYEEEPINYSKTAPSNAISRLQSRIDESPEILHYDETQGYLRSLLEVLQIPISTQVMTFAKTSLQAGHISPATPRSLYFNDDVHVGYVQDGLIEIAVSDPRLGMAFYTLDNSKSDKPLFNVQANRCLNCHGGARTRNVPGLQIRSTYPDPKGQPVIAAGSLRTDHTSPFEKRWGGWYVTGRHGSQTHLGNFTLPDDKKPKSIDNASGQNVIDLSSRLDTSKYLTPHSDLVSLMVLEHQTDAHNFLTLANFEARHALYVEEQERQKPNVSEEEIRKKTRARIEKSGDALVRYLLFSGEAHLKEPLSGTSDFAKDFCSRGPRDQQGRSLRDFDLTSRLFKYPCSYLIYSDAFASLPTEMKDYVYRRLKLILSEDSPVPEFSHLSQQDRRDTLGILLETIPDFAGVVFNPENDN
ncbi:MAG: hypothetical protein FJ267_02075 [Planctomycetes bacterium]|nr:hypothetical protein [Planctomycetota bacterium]